MNEHPEVMAQPEVGMVEAPVLVFNPETGEFETVKEIIVSEEGTVAAPADITLN